MGGVFEKRRVGETAPADPVGIKTGGAYNFVWAVATVREFSNSAGGSVTVDLDTSHDKVANSKKKRVAGLVGAPPIIDDEWCDAPW